MKKLLLLLCFLPVLCIGNLITKNLDNNWHVVNLNEVFCATAQYTAEPYNNLLLECQYKSTPQNSVQYMYDFKENGKNTFVGLGDFKPVHFYENNNAQSVSICTKMYDTPCAGFTCPTFYVKCMFIQPPKKTGDE